MKPLPVKPGLWLFLILLVFLLLAPCGSSPAGEDTSPPEALFRVSRIRPDVRFRLSDFGEVLEFETDSALIRTTQRRAELLAEAGAEITRVFAPTSLSAPPVPSRVISKSGAEEPVIREILNLVDRDGLEEIMGDLTGENLVTIGGVERRILTRNSYQTEGIAWATGYAYERLEGLGLEVAYHEYEYNGNSWRNVVAEQPGSVNPEQIYIICAHIDNLPTGPVAPGADDNASGSTAVLAAAGILSDYSFEYTVRYLLFTGEEQGLIGSYYYVQDVLAAGDFIAGALNFDMIAYDGDSDGAMEIYSGTTGASNLLGDLFLDTIEVYGLALDPVY
ncbi:MAG: M28 family peptidase [Candidatus Erginobacter occultus]|nr:M28 family peptidase [Candidatus Erginobacter occultus]